MIVAIIPAKEKSRRLSGKNMKILSGKPMIDYTIEYARSCSLLDEIYVSTNSEEIAEYARNKKLKVIVRPESLCSGVLMTDVMRHAVESIQNSEHITHVICLQVDHPDRTLDLTRLIRTVVDGDIADMITIEPDGFRNGSIRIFRKRDLMDGKISHSIMAVRDGCTNVHYQEDFERAQANIEQRLKR